MSEPITINLSVPLEQVGILGAEPEESPEQLAARQISELREQLQAQQSAAQARIAEKDREVAQVSSALREATDRMAEFREQITREMHQAAVELSLQIAEKILLRQVQAGEYDISAIVRSALEQLPARGEMSVHLNPRDYQSLSPDDGGGESSAVRYVSDPSVPAAGCVVQSPEGRVESTVNECLRQVSRALKELD